MPEKTAETTVKFINIRIAYIITFFIAFIMSFILVCRGVFPILILINLPIVLSVIPFFNKTSSVSKLIDRKWLVVFIMLNLLIVVPELFLRLVNFNYDPGVTYGNLESKFSRFFIPDKELMWKYSSNEPGVNAYGFYGPEVVTPKPANTKRILFFGDSCIEQNYAWILEQSLKEKNTNPGIKFECLVFAIAGYSSFQGKKLVEKYAKTLEADLAFICYGWNDHWLTSNNKDDEYYSSNKSYIANTITHHSKILQLARKLIAPLFKTDQKKSSDIVRVPIKKYRDNIFVITEELKNCGTKPILLTTPTSFYNNGVPDYIVNSGLAVNENSVITKHREYNEVIRNIAKNQKAFLLDSDEIISRLKNPDCLFLGDGIHFSSSGLDYMASLIYSFLIENQLI